MTMKVDDILTIVGFITLNKPFSALSKLSKRQIITTDGKINVFSKLKSYINITLTVCGDKGQH